MFLHETNWKYSPDSTGQRAQSWTVVNKLQRASECSFISTIPSNGTHCMFKIWGVEEDGRNEKKMKLKRKSIAERVKSFHLKTTTKTTILPLNNWNSNLDIKRRKKKKDLFYSLRYTSVPKAFLETATMPQGIANAFCHHSHPLKCTLDTTERKLGQGKNETKQNQSIAHQRKYSFFFLSFFLFPGFQRNDVSLKQTHFLSLHAPQARTLAHTHTHTLTQASDLVVGIHLLNNHFCK